MKNLPRYSSFSLLGQFISKWSPIVFTLFYVVLATPLFSQNFTTLKTTSVKAKKSFDVGVELMNGNRPQQALAQFEKALKYDPQFIDAQIFLAGTYSRLGQLQEAEVGFEKALQLSATYDIEVLFDVGLAEWKQEKFAESAAHFEQYLQTNSRQERRKAKAKKYQMDALFRVKALEGSVPFEPKNLGANINTPNHEYLPSLTADEETLVYTRLHGGRGGQEDFFMSHWVDGTWQKAEPMDALNTPYDEGGQSIAADGKTLVFTICHARGGMGMCDLYISELRKDGWTAPRNMATPVNTGANEKQPSLSSDGNTLYFSSDRGRGKGKMDIWVTHKKPNGKWQVPTNVSEVNTSRDDRAPFIHADGETLYFMSDGLPGMGDDDIYFSRKQEDGTWGIPQNIGYPINTEKEEGLMVVSLDGKTAYFASDRTDLEGAQGKMDIYSFELYEAARPQPVTYVKAKVFDAETRRKLVAQVEFVDLGTGKIYTSAQTDDLGEFLVTLPLGRNYLLNVSKEKYLFHSENFALKKMRHLDEPFLLKIGLLPIPDVVVTELSDTPKPNSKPVILKNVFFETGSAELLQESMLELTRLKNLLEQHLQLSIQINGHTDNIGSEEANLSLSENRAKAVYHFLIENGIAENRLNFKGYGESEPIAPNESEEGRKENRRTEFIIIK